VDLEQYRKDTKRLVRDCNAGDRQALARAEDALGARARERFLLSDAQHVVALERGYRSWSEMKRSLEAAAPERPVVRIGRQPVSDYELRAEQLITEAAKSEEQALRRIRAHVPRLRGFGGGALARRDAQLVIAREYGFQSWRELVRTVERVTAEHQGQREGSPDVRAALTAIEQGDVERLDQLLNEHPALAGACHNGAWNSLLEAVAQPDVFGTHLGLELGVDRPVVELLISRTGDLDGPLNLAACFNRRRLVELLLEAGADPCPSPQLGLTPLETALYHGSREAAELLAERGISPLALWTTAALERIELMQQFFDQNGRLLPTAGEHRPNLADVGWPPGPPPREDSQEILDEALCHAAHNGRESAAAWLLDHGANVDGRPYLDLTPLHFAVQFGHASTVRLLLDRGADRTITDRIHTGTPLGWAEMLDHTEITRLLDPSYDESTVETGLEYRPGDPVIVHVVRRERRVFVTDAGAAVERAGRRRGWQEVGRRIDRELVVNVSRHGVISLPVVAAGPGRDAIVQRIGEASLAFYQELLELRS